MNEGLIPKRYAKALYKHAIEKGEADKVYEQMKQLSNSFAAHKEMQAIVANPYLPNEDKIKVLLTASGASAGDTLDKFLRLTIKNNRIDYIHSMALDYQQFYCKANSIETVVITTASDIEESELDKIRKVVQAHEKGMKLDFTHVVNPDIIGGFTVKMDAKILDASIKNELKKLRLKLLS